MSVFICVDEKMGLLFREKRLSRDRQVIHDIVEIAHSPIYIESYSAVLFNGLCDDFVIKECLEPQLTKNYCCFLENMQINNFIHSADEVIIYSWNRIYPSDFFLDVDFIKYNFKNVSTHDFKGHSHDKITRRIFKHV